MRKTTAVLAAVGFLFLGAGACGDDDADDGDADSGSAAGNGSESNDSFCDGLEEVFSDLGAGADADVSEEQGRAAIEKLRDLDPPDEVADDFDTFLDYLEALATGEQPDAATTDAWVSATERVNTFAEDECGLTSPGSS
jgi:hypothetical protein